jgi:hypothetical protein
MDKAISVVEKQKLATGRRCHAAREIGVGSE